MQNTMYEIKLMTEEKAELIIPFLQFLNETIPANTLQERLTEMFKNNYKCVGVFDGEKLIGLSGLWILTKYYIGKHIEPDNVIIHPQYQKKGIGKLLTDWIHQYGIEQGCVAAELNCYISNKEGQRFWEKQGYEIKAYHYRKTF